MKIPVLLKLCHFSPPSCLDLHCRNHFSDMKDYSAEGDGETMGDYEGLNVMVLLGFTLCFAMKAQNCSQTLQKKAKLEK